MNYNSKQSPSFFKIYNQATLMNQYLMETIRTYIHGISHFKYLLFIFESICAFYQLGSNVWFKLGMPGEYDQQFTLGKNLVQVICRASWAYNVVSTLKNTTGDMTDLVDIFFLKQPSIARKETFVVKVVVLYTRESVTILCVTMSFTGFFPAGRDESRCSTFPQCPG